MIEPTEPTGVAKATDVVTTDADLAAAPQNTANTPVDPLTVDTEIEEPEATTEDEIDSDEGGTI